MVSNLLLQYFDKKAHDNKSVEYGTEYECVHACTQASMSEERWLRERNKSSVRYASDEARRTEVE